MKHFCFTIDDNILFLKDLMEQNLESIFQHPYVIMLRNLHEKFDLKIQLNMFYRTDDFDLSQMSDRYAREFQSVSDWLKVSFHSDHDNVNSYATSGYDEVFADCHMTQEQLLRFAGPDSLAKTTTIHYCRATDDGIRALADNGFKGLLGIFGTDEKPRESYGIPESTATVIRKGQIVSRGGMNFAAIDMVINAFKLEDIVPKLTEFLSFDSIRVMIHEQYYRKEHRVYQPDFEEKLITVFSFLRDNGYKSCFFEDLI